MMIEAYKCYDGQVLGSDKVCEGSGENEGKIGDIPEPPKPHHKNAYALSQIHLGTDWTQPQLHQCFLPKQMISRNPSSSRVT
jgi:hypothetical protein